jgi:hypothetical protein
MHHHLNNFPALIKATFFSACAAAAGRFQEILNVENLLSRLQ